jgi:hypothetical protein
MPRVALTDLFGLPDILSGDAFYFLMPGIPGTNGNLRNLALKCLNVQIPGVSNEKMTVPLHSHQINFRGRRIQPQSLSVTFYEDQLLQSFMILKGWHEYVVGTKSGNSQAFKAGYAITATCDVYNHLGVSIDTITYYNLFPSEVPDITMDGSSSTPVQISVTLSYDYTDSLLNPST